MIRKFLKYLKKRISKLGALKLITREELCIRDLESLALKGISSLTSVGKNDEDSPLIISLTTYSQRIHDVHLVIESLGRQTLKADKIILWLDEQEFSDSNLPLILKSQLKRGLEIKYCENLRSYKKLIPTIKLYPNSNIITTDDDIIYPYDFVELLIKESSLHPDTIICNHAHKIKMANGRILKYKDWEFNVNVSDSSDVIFPVGVGGVLYPKGCLDDRLILKDLFLSLAPSADDIWFKCMSLLKGIPSKKITDTRLFEDRFVPISRAQFMALHHKNVSGGENDKQFDNILKHFGIPVSKIFSK
jgi:hypothetical protein